MNYNIDENEELRSSIEQWAVRCKRAKKKHYQLAKEAMITTSQLSLIINFKSKKPHKSTIDSIERVLKSWGV